MNELSLNKLYNLANLEDNTLFKNGIKQFVEQFAIETVKDHSADFNSYTKFSECESSHIIFDKFIDINSTTAFEIIVESNIKHHVCEGDYYTEGSSTFEIEDICITEIILHLLDDQWDLSDCKELAEEIEKAL